MAPSMLVNGSQASTAMEGTDVRPRTLGSSFPNVDANRIILFRRVPSLPGILYPILFRSPGKRHGAGTLMFDGGIFEGQWARGEASGSGIATQPASDYTNKVPACPELLEGHLCPKICMYPDPVNPSDIPWHPQDIPMKPSHVMVVHRFFLLA